MSIILYNMPGVWMNSGYAGGLPIFGTITNLVNLGGTDEDNYYLVMPGYKLAVWQHLDFTGINTVTEVNGDNTDGTSILFVIPTTINMGSSCKVWFKGIELNAVYNVV